VQNWGANGAGNFKFVSLEAK